MYTTLQFVHGILVSLVSILEVSLPQISSTLTSLSCSPLGNMYTKRCALFPQMYWYLHSTGLSVANLLIDVRFDSDIIVTVKLDVCLFKHVINSHYLQ